MAIYFNEPSRTFSEYLLIPGYTSEECIPDNVSLRTPLVKFRKGEEPTLSLNVPFASAIMQSVSNDTMAIALAKEGGISFIYGSQSIEDEAAMVARVKSYKAGFVPSASNITPDATLKDVLELKERNGYSTMAVTEDGSATGKLLGIVSSRDYRVSRMELSTCVSEFMTPLEKLVTAPEGTSLKEANDIIWDHKLNSLPIVDAAGRLLYFVFRKDYAEHKNNPNEILDDHKRYVVGAGINSRDYAERVPALIEAGADVLCIDSSEGFSCWQKKTIDFIREFDGRDARMAQTVISPTYKMKISGRERLYSPNWKVTRTGYHPIKWSIDDDADNVLSKAASWNSLPILRYAEVLLNYAEAKAELGEMDAAVWDQTIAQLRSRAGVTPVVPDKADPYMEAYFLNTVTDKWILEVRRERGIELCLEMGLRWDDDMRWHMGDLLTSDNNPWTGIWIGNTGYTYDFTGQSTDDNGDPVPDFYIRPGEDTEHSIAISNTGANQTFSLNAAGNIVWEYKRTWGEKKYLRPIPQTAITRNPNLEQNALWK